RQAVRNGQAKLVIINSVPIRLTDSASKFLHIRPGSEDAVVLALMNSSTDALVARKTGIEEGEFAVLRQLIAETPGSVVLMFGSELTSEAQALFAQIPTIPTFYNTGSNALRFMFHPLAVYNNSVGVYDIGLMNDQYSVTQVLNEAGTDLRALYMAGSLAGFTAEDLEKLSRLDLLIVQELFETDTTEYADVVLPAASFAEVDGTFTNNAGLVQRVRQSIPPVNLSKPDWLITSQLGRLLVKDFEFPSSASDIFREIAANIPAYEGLRYPLLKDESKPVQVKHKIMAGSMTGAVDLSTTFNSLYARLHARIESLDESREKITATPKLGHELFKPGILTGKVPQFPLLDSGNPKPPTVLIAPLYQITVDSNLHRATLTGVAD
ncbi:MAG: molybdopterin oxidoreductase family protein, partial [Pyrinomonadaceae bacterium]